MAQHISIKNTTNKKLQNLYQKICKQFNNVEIAKIRNSLKNQENYDDRFKISETDNVFQTWRTLNCQRECLEIHFDSKNEQITQIYLVK